MDKTLWNVLVGKKIQEKRISRRILAGDPFFVEFRQKGRGSTFAKGHACDLSATGISFTTMTPIQPGAVLELVLSFSPRYGGVQTATVNAEVVRVEFGTGKFIRSVACHFKDPSYSFQKTLQDFIAWLLTFNREKFVQDRSWKVSAHDLFFVEFDYGGREHKGYGSELSIVETSFASSTAPSKGSLITLRIHFSPHFPGPTSVEMQGRVLMIQKSALQKPFFDIQCRLVHENPSTHQVLESFLKWLMNAQG